MRLLDLVRSLFSAAALRSLFSPYELAAGGRLVGIGTVLFAIVLMMTGRPIAGFVFAGLSFVAQFAIGELSRCPTCGKRPTKRYLLNRETGIGQLFFVRLWWPERVCSSCRSDLDGI